MRVSEWVASTFPTLIVTKHLGCSLNLAGHVRKKKSICKCLSQTLLIKFSDIQRVLREDNMAILFHTDGFLKPHQSRL